jgi:hypothetical protein
MRVVTDEERYTRPLGDPKPQNRRNARAEIQVSSIIKRLEEVLRSVDNLTGGISNAEIDERLRCAERKAYDARRVVSEIKRASNEVKRANNLISSIEKRCRDLRVAYPDTSPINIDNSRTPLPHRWLG